MISFSPGDIVSYRKGYKRFRRMKSDKHDLDLYIYRAFGYEGDALYQPLYEQGFIRTRTDGVT